MKRTIQAFAVVCLFATVSFAACAAKTTVADTLYNSTQTALTGTIYVTNASVITDSGGCVVAANTRVSAPVVSGAFSIALTPNTGSTPAGTSYTAEFHVSSGIYRETWVIPASGPVALSGVRTTAVPTTQTTFASSQIAGKILDSQLNDQYSGVGACAGNTWPKTLNDDAAPTCQQPGFSNLAGSLSLSTQVSGVLPPANGGVQSPQFIYGFCGSPCPMSGSANSSGGVANRNNVAMWNIPVAITISKVTTRTVTANAGSVNDLGIYDVNKNLVANTGGFSTATTNTALTVNLAQGSVTLPAGTYYFAQCSSDIVSAIMRTNFDGTATQFLIQAGVPRVGRAANDCVAGVLPSSLGAITAGNAVIPAGAVFE
jgi:hypothetical protein